MKKFTWVNIYNKIAHKILEYKNNSKGLADLMYEMLDDLQLMHSEEKGTNLDKNENDERCRYSEIDPISFMNRFDMYSDNIRKKLIEKFEEKTGMNIMIPEDFEGVPSTNPQGSCVIRFKKDREKDDIPNIWELFDIALNGNMKKSEDKEKFIQYYNKVISKPYAKFNISIGLFKIRPDTFINLDEVNRNYIKKSIGININERVSGQEYLKIIEDVKEYIQKENANYTLLDFSYKAWKNKNLKNIQYWLYAPGENACLWDECYNKNIIAIAWDNLGDFKKYKSKKQIKEALQANNNESDPRNQVCAIWDFKNEISKGDIIIVKKGLYEILGYGEVISDYYYDNNRKIFKNVRNVDWKIKGEWKVNKENQFERLPQKTLTNITKYTEQVKQLMDLMNSNKKEIEKYDKNKFLEQIYTINTLEYDELIDLLNRKQNIILQGPPGVGKTFMAKRLAYSIIGCKDEERVKTIQFHQSYSYEDFIEGWRPTENGFKLEFGVFYKFCEEAKKHTDKKYFFIIDEINRGNISKVFGELLALIEKDKRNQCLILPYSKKEFYIPENIYIIGMMNTADRSLALMDYALRRRFAFFDVKPAFKTEKFKKYIDKIDNQFLRKTIKEIKKINNEISEDMSLGKGFEIGHSYFCNLERKNDKEIKAILKYEIIPLLEEYWMDDPYKIKTLKERFGVNND